MKRFLVIVAALSVLASCSKDDETVTPEEQLAIDVAIIDKYLGDNNITAEIHESEIRYVETEVGQGATPAVGDVVVLKFKADILNGNEFAESIYGNSFTLNSSLISAWQIMLPEMSEGGKMTFYAPSAYCFGTTESTSFAANSIFIFEMELVDVVTNSEEQFSADTTIIEAYLDDNGIDAVTHSSGIRYQVVQEGTGEMPEPSSTVEVRYTGTFINGAVFDQNTNGVTFALTDLIESWQIMIPEMKEGGELIIYSPSVYCYGSQGTSSIPPNTNLIFEIELLDVK